MFVPFIFVHIQYPIAILKPFGNRLGKLLIRIRNRDDTHKRSFIKAAFICKLTARTNNDARGINILIYRENFIYHTFPPFLPLISKLFCGSNGQKKHFFNVFLSVFFYGQPLRSQRLHGKCIVCIKPHQPFMGAG